MTIVLVGIVSIPLALLVSQHIESVFRSEDYTITRNLARFEMEVVNNTAYANIVSASSPSYQGYNYDVTRTVSFAQGTALTSESLKQIRITVTRHGSATVLVSLVTYIARNVSYGL